MMQAFIDVQEVFDKAVFDGCFRLFKTAFTASEVTEVYNAYLRANGMCYIANVTPRQMIYLLKKCQHVKRYKSATARKTMYWPKDSVLAKYADVVI